MSLGVFNNTGLGVSEFACPNAANNEPAKIACTVPTNYQGPQGQMDFLKRGAGGEIYIGLCGKKATAKSYDIVLTDSIPFYSLAGIALGDVWVLCSAPNVNISITIGACT